MLPDGTHATPLVAGAASAEAVVLSAPLSRWGGFDPVRGLIIDIHHPQHGQSIAGKAVIMTSGRGSSSASSVLVEAIRLGTAPAAFVLSEPDEILVLGAIVGEELYQVTTPIVLLASAVHATIADGQRVEIAPGGETRTG